MRWRRALTVLGLLPLTVLAQLGVALGADSDSRLGQTPPALAWIELSDSRGISVWNYELSLDRGGVTAPGRVVWATIIDLLWQIYRCGVIVAIWFIDWVLAFDWLAMIVTPVLSLADNLTLLVARVGGVTMLLTFAAVVAVCQMARGRWALGLTELLTSLVIASLATGALASPVVMIAGPGGALMNSRSIGLELADGLATDGSTSATGGAEQMRQRTTARLVDTFIRLPTQTLNFGRVLDGGRCQGAYDTVIAAGPYGQDDDIRTAIDSCDSTLGEVAGNPSAGQAASAAIISPAAALVLTFAILLAGTVLLAALSALYQGLKLIVTLVAGLLPGGARGLLWITIADLVMSLVTLVFAMVFLSGYLLLIASVFSSASPATSPMQTFFVVDVLLVAGLLLFWRGRSALKRASGKLASALATRPGAGPSALPTKRPFDAAGGYYKARMAAAAGSTLAGTASGLAVPAQRLAGQYADGRDRLWGKARNAASDSRVDLRATASWLRWAGRAPKAQPDQPGRSARPHGRRGPGLPASAPRQLGGGNSSGPDQGKPPAGPSSPSGAPQRVLALTAGRKPAGGRGRLVRTAGQLALAAGTGGSSAVVSTASKTAAQLATRTAVRSTLRTAQGARQPSSPSPATKPGGGPRTAAAGVPPASSPSPARPVPPPITRPPAPRPAPPAGPSSSGRVIDQDGQVVPAPAVRLQQRLAARRPPAGRQG